MTNSISRQVQVGNIRQLSFAKPKTSQLAITDAKHASALSYNS